MRMLPRRITCLLAVAASLSSLHASAQPATPSAKPADPGEPPATQPDAAAGDAQTGPKQPTDTTPPTPKQPAAAAEPSDQDAKPAPKSDSDEPADEPTPAKTDRPTAADARSTPAPAISPASVEPPTSARIEFGSNYAETRLEMRSLVQTEPWTSVCLVPCNTTVVVEGREARFAAPGMSTSNTFILEPGVGTARMRVAGGSQVAQTIGLASMIGGIPLALGGAALFAVGEVNDRPTLSSVGIGVGIVGAVAILTAVPLLIVGSTKVRDGRGSTIARRPAFPSVF